MMFTNLHPVRRCAPCDRDWPNTAAYNLCPRCQRCTAATTANQMPSFADAATEAERYAAIREFDAQYDAGRDAWNAEMEALLATTPSIPDPNPEAA